MIDFFSLDLFVISEITEFLWISTYESSNLIHSLWRITNIILMNLHILGLFRWNHNSLRCALSWFSDLEKEEDQKGLPKGNKKMFFKSNRYLFYSNGGEGSLLLKVWDCLLIGVPVGIDGETTYLVGSIE